MKMQTRSYQEYLIESLKDPSEAALYIWAILQEENPEPELLSSALQDVSQALGNINLSEKEAKIHLEKLHELNNKKGSDAIYYLSDWLKELNLTLTVIEDRQYHVKNIFIDLARIRDREKNTRKTSIWQGLAPGIWSKIFFIGIFGFFSLAFMFNVFFPIANPDDATVNTANANTILLFLMLGIVFIIFWLLLQLRLLLLETRNQKTPQQIREERLRKIGKEVEIELEEVNMLATKYSNKQLESAIRKLKSFLEEMEGKKKVTELVTPILVLISIGSIMYIYGLSPEDIEKSLPFFTSFGGFGFLGRLGGLLGFLFLIFKLLEEGSWQSQNTEYKRRLFILEEAKNMAEQKEADLKIVINKLIEERSPQ